MEKITGGQLTAEALIQQGVDTVFTLSGGHITPIYQPSGGFSDYDFRYPPRTKCGFYGRGLGPADP